jgi:hypothetical protein
MTKEKESWLPTGCVPNLMSRRTVTDVSGRTGPAKHQPTILHKRPLFLSNNKYESQTGEMLCMSKVNMPDCSIMRKPQTF